AVRRISGRIAAEFGRRTPRRVGRVATARHFRIDCLHPSLQASALIIGSGIAALRAALELSGAGDVVVLTKSGPLEGNTGYAQGGIAAAVGPDDSPDLHAADTIAAGDGLCDARAVEVLTTEGPRYVRELMAWGAEFDRRANGDIALTLEG